MAEIEEFLMYIVINTYGDVSMATGRAECWTVVLTMVRVICRAIRKFVIELETADG